MLEMYYTYLFNKVSRDWNGGIKPKALRYAEQGGDATDIILSESKHVNCYRKQVVKDNRNLL